jgi:hypothetical protein
MREVLVVVAALLAATTAVAAEAKFSRPAAVKLLGYDPERAVPEQCTTRSNTAALVRVALTKNAPQEELVGTHFGVAGLTGAARAVCPAASAPAALDPFVAAKAKLEKPVCEAARTALTGKIRKALDAMETDDHPDAVAGYIDALVKDIEPIRDACYDQVEAWGTLAGRMMTLEGEAKTIRANRACHLWRAAYFAELKKATDAGEASGRAAGLAYLKGNPLVTLAGSRNYCADDVGRAFEMSNYELTQTAIEAMPEKPAH